MSKEIAQVLLKNLENSVRDFVAKISEKHNLPEDELLSLWSSSMSSKTSTASAKSSGAKSSGAKSSGANSVKSSPLAEIDYDDLSPARLQKCTQKELSALCKSKSLKCSGKKDELLERLTSFASGANGANGGDQKESTTSKTVKISKAPVKSKTETKKAERAVKSLDVVKKLQGTIKDIAIRRNKWGNLEHPSTQIVFRDKTSKTPYRAYGTQQDNGKVAKLTDDDIENCRKYKFEYEMPENLDKDNLNDVKIDGLDEDEDEDVISDEDEAAVKEIEQKVAKKQKLKEDDIEEEPDEDEELTEEELEED